MSRFTVGIPTQGKVCSHCGYRLVWSSRQQQMIHTINTKSECPTLRKRDSNG